VREMKNRNSRMREIAFHTLFCMFSMVSILLTMQKKYTSENDPLQAQITMREFQFFESIIEKNVFITNEALYSIFCRRKKNQTPFINSYLFIYKNHSQCAGGITFFSSGGVYKSEPSRTEGISQ
jgi:hypothetical protein